MKGTLSRVAKLPVRLEDPHHPLRTDVIAGTFRNYPQLNHSFVFESDSLTDPGRPGSGRIVTTSLVKGVKYVDQVYTIRTMNSVYELVEDKPVKVTHFRKARS